MPETKVFVFPMIGFTGGMAVTAVQDAFAAVRLEATCRTVVMGIAQAASAPAESARHRDL